MWGAKRDSSCHTWTSCYDRYRSSNCADREPKPGRFPSSITASSSSRDSEYVSFWPKLPFKWGSSSGSRGGIGLLVYSVNWHFLHLSITVLVHLHFKVFCHSRLAKTSLSQTWLLLQLWEPRCSSSLFQSYLQHSLLYWLCLSKGKSRIVRWFEEEFLLGTGAKPPSLLLKSKCGFT